MAAVTLLKTPPQHALLRLQFQPHFLQEANLPARISAYSEEPTRCGQSCAGFGVPHAGCLKGAPWGQGPWSGSSAHPGAQGERVTGRKARGLQMEEIGFKCQALLSLLSGRRKQTSNIFFPSLYKFKRRFLLKHCVAIMTPGFT